MKITSHSAARRRRGMGNRDRCAGGRVRRCSPDERLVFRVESLEGRSLLSTLPLSGFPATGFRADQLGGTSQWEVAMNVDGYPTGASAYAESAERMANAPTVELSGGEPNWLAGIIGDTRLRKPAAAANDVDLYRIDLGGNEHYGVKIDLYAQRIGSTLDGALSIFDSHGQLIASNDDYDILGEFPQDAGRRLGLDGGTYFVAVSSGGNLPGTPGGFDPNLPGSGRASRGSTGPYLLRITTEPDSTRPQVVELSFDPGQTFNESPTRLTVRFSEAMDLDGLGAITEPVGVEVPVSRSATLTNDDGEQFGLRAIDYNADTYEVTYLLLDRPVAGHYRFALDASLVTDLADNPLDGGGPDADFAAEFSVNTSKVEMVDSEPNETAGDAQSVGVLFPTELLNGARISGTLESRADGSPDRDFFRFRVESPSLYTFRLRAADGSTNTDAQLTLLDAAGNEIVQAKALPGSGTTLYRSLKAEEYLVQVAAPGGALPITAPGGALPTTAPSGALPTESYQLTIQYVGGLPEIADLSNNDPGPAIQVVLRTNDGGSTTVLGPSQPDDANSASEWLSSAVSSLPAVGSQPIGRPRAEVGDPSLLAWAGGPNDGLPAGLVLGGDSGDASAHFSVAGVSGSFTDPLPDALPSGTYALSASPRAIAELAELVDRGLLDGTVGEAASALHGTLASLVDDLGLDRFLPDDASEAGPAAVSQASLSLGVVVGLGAASMLTVPNRRRTGNWISRALQLLGS